MNVQQLIQNKHVILFDGQCKLCDAWCNFIIKRDKKARFKLCSVQSRKGHAVLNYFHYPTDNMKSMVYVDNEQCFTQSDAVIRVLSQLGWPWRAVLILSLIPKRLRDWGYDRVAFNRYHLFGKFNYCRLPHREDQRHYL